MSKIKNGGLDQYGKVWSLNGIGGERVKCNIIKENSSCGDTIFAQTDAFKYGKWQRQQLIMHKCSKSRDFFSLVLLNYSSINKTAFHSTADQLRICIDYARMSLTLTPWPWYLTLAKISEDVSVHQKWRSRHSKVIARTGQTHRQTRPNSLPCLISRQADINTYIRLYLFCEKVTRKIVWAQLFDNTLRTVAFLPRDAAMLALSWMGVVILSVRPSVNFCFF